MENHPSASNDMASPSTTNNTQPWFDIGGQYLELEWLGGAGGWRAKNMSQVESCSQKRHQKTCFANLRTANLGGKPQKRIFSCVCGPLKHYTNAQQCQVLWYSPVRVAHPVCPWRCAPTKPPYRPSPEWCHSSAGSDSFELMIFHTDELQNQNIQETENHKGGSQDEAKGKRITEHRVIDIKHVSILCTVITNYNVLQLEIGELFPAAGLLVNGSWRRKIRASISLSHQISDLKNIEHHFDCAISFIHHHGDSPGGREASDISQRGSQLKNRKNKLAKEKITLFQNAAMGGRPLMGKQTGGNWHPQSHTS